MTPKQVQKKLNQLCLGLGDAWIENLKYTTRFNLRIKSTLSLAVQTHFPWHLTNEGGDEWCEIYIMIYEMEEAELI